MTEWPDKPPLGAGLLGVGLAQDRDDLVAVLGAAYRNVMDERRRNFGLWHVATNAAVEALQARYKELGFEAAPLYWRALWNRVALPGPANDPNAHLRFVAALMTPFDQELADHVLYRMRTGGNVHIAFSGPTGMGKSSCAVALADWIKPLNPEELPGHLSFDTSDLSQKLKDKTPGQTVIQDEYLATAGEGSRTIQGIVANIEDTLRASQVNLFVCSPESKDHKTMQAELELILWNPKKSCSCFVVWVQGEPHGVVALPWMPAHLWAAYKPWKDANVARSQSGHFRDNAYLVRMVCAVFSDERLVDFLEEATNEPTKKDIKGALSLFAPQMMAGAQEDTLVDFAHVLLYAWDRLEPKFETYFGTKPPPGIGRVAAKCLRK